ncbi:MAG: type II toxin-antitoxin system prevent-host-death family antitoxin [Nitrospira sp.]|nr:type II toxin-antitoxin system prevent-host-death family antitoxin [Nitrospira sp.]
MGITYSTCDAKARFSGVLRLVRDGKTVTVSYRGKPVAEIRAIRLRRSNRDSMTWNARVL